MKLHLALLALLLGAPAMADAQTALRQPAARPQPAIAPPPNGWTIPMAGFAEAFNRVATQVGQPVRAVEAGCNDIRIPGPGRACEYRVGHLVIFASAKEDRSTLDNLRVYLEGPGETAAVEELRSTFTVLTQLLEPSAPQARRAAATSVIQSEMVSFALNSREAVLGGTRFHLVVIRAVRSILRVDRADVG